MSEKSKNIFLVFLNMIVVVLILLTGVNILLKEDLLKSINLDYQTNDFCQTIKNSSNISTNNLDYLVCDNKFKKKKIIILFIDCLPYDSLHDFLNFKESKLVNLYRAEGIEYKQSGALFETILTGKFSRNYLASNIMKMDNLPQQLKNANMNVFYLIRDFPLYGLIDKKLGTQIVKHKGERTPLLNLCNTNLKPFSDFGNEISKNYVDESNIYFKEGINQDYLYEKANEKLKPEFEKIRNNFNKCFSQKDFNNTVYYTDALDHLIHVMHRSHPIPLYAIYFLEQYVKELIRWINEEHDEFALALASDHGGQSYSGEDTLCNHGCNSLGNEGVFFVYTKELGVNYDKYKIIGEKEPAPIVSLDDFACTVTQAIKDANLPLESDCTPRPIGNDKLFRFTTVKAKEIQLKKYIEKLSLKYPELSNQYHSKYDKKLNNHKYAILFKDMDSIYKTDEKTYDEYMKYIMDIQKELFKDVILSSQNTIYFVVFCTALVLFILGLLYFIRQLIVLTKNQVLKEIKKFDSNKNPFLSKIVRYTYILFLILLIEPIIYILYNDSKNISHYINISVFAKFIALLLFVIFIAIFNNLKKNNYIKLIVIIIAIIILHLIMSKIELFITLDKYINTQKRSDFFKIVISYPLAFIYLCIEIYSYRNYYLSLKYKIRYIYILVPYLILLFYYLLKFDMYLKITNNGHNEDIIRLLKRSYRMIFLLLLFIKPFYGKDNAIRVLSREVINIKLFIFIMISFICVESERVEIFPSLIVYYFIYVIVVKKKKICF